VRVQKRERLKNLDFFCLDNSLRESTVGQLRSHTLQNKINILEQVKKCGVKDKIVASFNNSTRVDDEFVEYLIQQKEDFSCCYSFSEVSQDGVVDGIYETEKIPVGLEKNKKYGLYNTFFECDLVDGSCQWGKWTVRDMCKLLRKRINYVFDEISPKARVLLNLRDFPVAMSKHPKRVLRITRFLSKLPADRRMFALCFEDPLGEYLPEELEAWTASIRRTMDSNGWSDGKILVHIHQKWDLQTASQLDCLSAGADGVWASLCEEGAALGHACSSVTMMNLVRMGNTKVQKKYKCTELRKAAMAVTQITTGLPPHPKQPVYGKRAVDLVFGFLGVGDFDLAAFFGEPAPIRITTLATKDMIRDKLTLTFGENPQFRDEKILTNMKEQMLLDLHAGRKEEYQSDAGIAVLFDRCGGRLTGRVAEVVSQMKYLLPHHDNLIAEIRKEWDRWDNQEKGKDKGDGQLRFDSFYHGFMSPYFGCYKCSRTRNGLKCLDMNSDGYVGWDEFLVYLKWALRQYPKTEDPEVLLSIVFEKGILPAMRDESVMKTLADDDYSADTDGDDDDC
jgi:hypothetical protein